MEALDTSIVNVAMGHVAGTLSASRRLTVLSGIAWAPQTSCIKSWTFWQFALSQPACLSQSSRCRSGRP
jgi:hypothetical protein